MRVTMGQVGARSGPASQPRRSRDYEYRWYFSVCILIIIVAVSGCATQQAIEDAHRRGASEGREVGRLKGYEEGRAEAFKAVRIETYRTTLRELYASNEFRRIPVCKLAVMSGFAILGFSLQWSTMYLFRRTGFLTDIDWIILPDQISTGDLATLSTASGRALTVLLIMLPIIGCKTPETDAWQKGYDGNFLAAYREGWDEGTVEGTKEGAEDGRKTAQYAAASGLAWQLYSAPALWSVFFGIVLGVSAQYIVLLNCRISGVMSDFLSVAFVPAMKRSVSYAVFERRRQLMIECDEEIRRLSAHNQLQVWRMRAIHDGVVRGLKTISSLEDLTSARLLDLARRELSQIVSASEMEANRISNGQRQAVSGSAKLNCYCPHCNGAIEYPEKKAGQIVPCPYKKCGREFRLPQLASTGRDRKV